MKSFTDWYKVVSGGHEPPSGNIPYSWFEGEGFPMIVKCYCCEGTMLLVNSYIDENGYIFCPKCAGIEEN